MALLAGAQIGLSLPLSSLWATVSLETAAPSHRGSSSVAKLKNIAGAPSKNDTKAEKSEGKGTMMSDISNPFSDTSSPKFRRDIKAQNRI
ncbi:hypothetical protein EJ08DRAFT_654299 [Tothia fuscella]|uniref:Uncharacterized protein n=1 Tax=Tothia fuscella TaxID=1048955 RepID=A0A9P4TSV2_9PEZI|nr:hypothetical protein EJ08DRAFT_654299 [Tothia fuscella]